MLKLFIAFITVFMPLVTGFNGLSFTTPLISDSAEVVYDYDNEIPGSAAGTVTVTAKLNGSYDLYWGTDEGEKLSENLGGYTVYYSEFAEVDVKNGEGSTVPTAVCYQAGVEVDSAGAGTYKWTKYNKDGAVDTDWGTNGSKTGKTLSVSNTDVNTKATFMCEVTL